MNNNLERFLKYVKVETTSNEDSNTLPSSSGQLTLAKMLSEELKALNVDHFISDKGIIYGKINSNNGSKEKVGFLAHMDTAMDASGKNVKPQIISNYNLEDIKLDEEKTLSPKEFPSLLKHQGKTLITTSGDTLLGADDKAGITIIMGLIEYLVKNPDFKHKEVHFAFTIDEEIATGIEYFDVDEFNCDYAFTIDGGDIDEVEYECFNGADCEVTIKGVSIHPGSAKGIMINSMQVANEFMNLLPKHLDPSLTEKYEGFNHLTNISGTVELTKLNYIIRNHDSDLFNSQKEDFIEASKFLNKKYKKELVSIKITDSYYNMAEILKDHMDIIDLSFNALKNNNQNPKAVPIRGGTDGARLTFKGIPTPNLGTGGYNYHGVYEYLVLEDLEVMIKVLLDIVK